MLHRHAAWLLAPALALAGAGCSSAGGSGSGDPSVSTTTTSLGGAAGSSTGNADVDAVLALLERTERAPFTATYELTRKLGPVTASGVVAHDGQATSVTVGDMRFVLGDQVVTCSLSAKSCEAGTLDARISDLSVGSSFWAAAPARALRVAYERRSGDPTRADAQVGGVATTCVQVPLGQGVETYCATPAGTLARWDTAAVNVELQSLTDHADPAAFVVPGR